jgi:hypothetical protein
MESKQKQPGLYEPRFEHDNCGIGAVANIKGIRSHHTVDQAFILLKIWNTGQERTLRARQETAWVSCSRFPTDFLRR